VSKFLPKALVRPRTEEPKPGERAAAERYSVSVQVGILSEDGQASGAVKDISVTGARIEGVPHLPEPGSHLRLGFSFYAHALPVPIHARVVRQVDEAGFAVEFEDVDFRTQILLRALLPRVCEDGIGGEAGLPLNDEGLIALALPPLLLAACAKVAAREDVKLEDWIMEQLERAALQGLADEG